METTTLYKVLLDPGKGYAKRVLSEHTLLDSAIQDKQRYEILNDSKFKIIEFKIIKETTTKEEITFD